MVRIFALFANFFSRKEQHLGISEEIKGKIDLFLQKFFPGKAETKLRAELFSEIVSEFEVIKRLVLGIGFFDYFERRHIEHILGNLSAYYFDRLPRIKKDLVLSKKETSEIINSLLLVRDLVVRRLERKHKDISHLAEGMKLQAQHILETYFDGFSGNQLNALRMLDLKEDFDILNNRVNDFKKVTKKFQSQYAENLM